MKRSCLSTKPVWMALLGSIVGMSCGLPQVGLPAATRMASDAGGDAGRDSEARVASDAGGNSEKICGLWKTIDLTQPEGEVILVVDRSTSMSSPNQDRCLGCTTYWDSLREALTFISEDEWDQFRYGMKLYPSADSSCQVSKALDVPVSSDGWQEVASLLYSTSPGGPAPATPGLQLAIDTLRSSTSLAPKMIVLALASVPACGGTDMTQDDTSAVMSEIGRAAGLEIPVYVLGVGRIQATLDRLVNAGITYKAYSAYMPQDLLEEMQGNAMMNAPCTYALPSALSPSRKLNLYLEDMDPDAPRRPVSDSEFTVASDGTSVTLLDQACADLRGPSAAALRIEINCPG